MKSVAFHIQKGGQGKTTLTGNIGYTLSQKGKKVLLVDSDPSQGNLTTWLVPEPKEGEEDPVNAELGDYLLGKVEFNDLLVPIRKNLDLVPTISIDSSLKEFIDNKIYKEESLYLFDDFLEEAKKKGYDFVLFDLAPSMQAFEKKILKAVDEVIAPLEPEFFGLDGIEISDGEIKTIQKNRERSHKALLIKNKIIVNKINFSFKSHKSTLSAFKKNDKYQIFLIRQDRNISEAIYYHQFLEEYKNDSKAKENFYDVCSFLLEEV